MTNVICDEEIPDWEYAKRGIDMWLNNNPDKAEEYFKVKLDRTKIYSSYAFTTVMNAVISYELDKIEIAQEMLRELEKRCTPTVGWIQTLKTRIFGQDIANLKLTSDILEERIIVADALMCSAILTFLTQDIGGLMKGSWLLRKAWKIYEQLYGQIYNIYKSVLQESGEQNIKVEPVTPSIFCTNAESTQLQNGFVHHENSPQRNGYKNATNNNSVSKSSRNFLRHMPQSVSTIFPTEKFTQYIPKRVNNEYNSTNKNRRDSSTSTQPSKTNLHLNLTSSQSNGFLHQVPLSYPEPFPSPISSELPTLISDIDLRTAKRLMGAVSFGFGIFQLSVSLLPPSLLKIISILGFEGNRNIGIACLNYTRKTEDMRAPLATLALLWYNTIGAQLFHTDDAQMPNEIDAARHLLRDSRPQYATSAIFLFFNARLKRLQGKTSIAIDLYDAAYRMSAQRELKMLCLHEVGWCRLIHLDFGNAMLHFHELKLASNFSKSFYAYMTTICQGAFGRFDNLIKLKAEIINLVRKNNYKETQIDKFILRRINKLPSSEDNANMFDIRYWKFFIYEMLFLWNALHSCPPEILIKIISECSPSDNPINEPSVGLANLILGACKMQMRQMEAAINEFRECIQKRSNIVDDIYISAYANYELATILMKQQNEKAKEEAKNLLLNVQRLYKNYDFESRLSARVYTMLKQM